MIQPLPPEALALGSDPSLLREELVDAIQKRIDANPRNSQIEIGASEIGTPCTRKLVFKLGHVPPAQTDRTRWPMAVGTIIHADLADMLEQWNAGLALAGEHVRWGVEVDVEIGTFENRVLRGHVDGYDRVTASVFDWKNLGITSLRKMRREDNPGQTYRVQLHCYGSGLLRMGLPVDRVHVIAIPQGGELSQLYHWSEPHNPRVTEWALNRAAQIVRTGEEMGYGKLAALAQTREDYCDSCPWFAPYDSDPEKGRCPGSDEIQRQRSVAASRPAPRPFS
jgi:hypothetical protein